MNKGNVIWKVLIVAAAVAAGLWAAYVLNGYKAARNSVLKVDKIMVNVNVDDMGIAHITEHDYYTFTKPYHGLAPNMSLPRGVTMNNFKVSVQGAKILQKEGEVTKHGFKLRIYLNKGYNIPKPSGDKVVMTLSYDVYGAVQNGQGFSQFFHKFWGADTPSFVPILNAVYTFPKSFKIKDAFFHPIDVEHTVMKAGNSIAVTYLNVPPNSYAEARFVFSPLKTFYSSSLNKNLDEILKIEKSYAFGFKVYWYTWIVLLSLMAFIPLVFFLLFGREPRVEIHSEYERELPYKDPPAVVNAVVKKLVGEPDGGAFAASVLNLVKKGYLEFHGKSAFKMKTGNEQLDDIESDLLKSVIEPFSVEGVFDPVALHDTMKESTDLARQFLSAYSTWKSKVALIGEERNYMITIGNVLVKVLSVALFVVAIFFTGYILHSKLYPELSQYAVWFSFVIWTAMWIVLVMPRDVFGRWSKAGREYYLRWKNFEKYITDYSLLKEKPPQSVKLWDEYLVYATALGVAKKVIENIKEVNPKIEENSTLAPAWAGMYWYSSLHSLPTFAAANSVQSQGSSSNGGGFGGNVGGGFGGGGRGGF